MCRHRRGYFVLCFHLMDECSEGVNKVRRDGRGRGLRARRAVPCHVRLPVPCHVRLPVQCSGGAALITPSSLGVRTLIDMMPVGRWRTWELAVSVPLTIGGRVAGRVGLGRGRGSARLDRAAASGVRMCGAGRPAMCVWRRKSRVSAKGATLFLAASSRSLLRQWQNPTRNPLLEPIRTQDQLSSL